MKQVAFPTENNAGYREDGPSTRWTRLSPSYERNGYSMQNRAEDVACFPRRNLDRQEPL